MEILYKIKQWLNSFMYDPVDVYDAHKLLFFMSQIFGLISYRLYRNNNGVREYRSCYIFAIINVFIILIFLSAFIFLTIKFVPMMESIADFNIIEMYANCFQYLLATIEVFAGCFVMKKIIKIFQNIEEIDKNFRAISLWISYK